MARFTVLGSHGFIGARLVRHLRDRDAEVLAPARDGGWPDKDLGHVIYCIGMTADYLADPAATAEAHIGRLIDLLAGARFGSLVYLSSTRLYDWGGAEARETDDLALNPATPRHLFDLTKAAGEALCIHSGRGVVARLASVYSDDLASDNFLHRVIRDAIAAPRLAIDTAADLARDYIHIDDVCTLLARLATEARRPIYNLASGTNLTNRELFAMVGRAAGCRITATRAPAAAPAPRIDISAIAQDFALTPRPPIAHIARIVAQNRDQTTALRRVS
jgi:UDP-glucose 4-epimerase